LLALGRAAEAERAFECALRIDPANAHIRSCLAKAKAGLR